MEIVKERSMASIIRPAIVDRDAYRGLDWIFEYTNHDGRLTTWNCGQAAIATFLTHHGALDPVNHQQNMEAVEANHGPDQLWGWFGTGRRRVERALAAFNVHVMPVEGEDAIRSHLEKKNPVLLMVGLPSYRLLGINLPGGHWMVAYGYENDLVHLTNWGAMTWPTIRQGWKSISARWIGMNGRGLAKRV